MGVRIRRQHYFRASHGLCGCVETLEKCTRREACNGDLRFFATPSWRNRAEPRAVAELPGQCGADLESATTRCPAHPPAPCPESRGEPLALCRVCNTGNAIRSWQSARREPRYSFKRLRLLLFAFACTRLLSENGVGHLNTLVSVGRFQKDRFYLFEETTSPTNLKLGGVMFKE